MENVIEIKNVSKSFGKNDAYNQVLKETNISITKGEFVSLMGPSGSGKSTLLYLIGGLDRDYTGDIELAGKNISKMKERELSNYRLNKIGFVFQFYNLVMNLNVEDNLMLPQVMKGKTRKELQEKVTEILELVGLTEKRKAMPNTLSGGQQQRVAIARALLGEPEIIIADEPTGNLDAKSTEEIMELFVRINQMKKVTILQVTHSVDVANYGQRIVRLENGKAVG
ncbi:MAG: ABC transporter ATP-binding protein [Eubacteriales bacterium]|nr:ABC transporter ATP-binding protein [Eubacteriales bacterium]